MHTRGKQRENDFDFAALDYLQMFVCFLVRNVFLAYFFFFPINKVIYSFQKNFCFDGLIIIKKMIEVNFYIH